MAAIHAGFSNQSVEINQDLSWFSSFARAQNASAFKNVNYPGCSGVTET
jgi:hypothetical protein